MAPAALPIREVISASMEPSAETIQQMYVNEGTNSRSSPSVFIVVVIAEDGEIIMVLVLVQLTDIPTSMSVRHPFAKRGFSSSFQLAHKIINDTIEEVGGNHTTLAEAGCNGEPFRQVISDTTTAFTVGVEEF